MYEQRAPYCTYYVVQEGPASSNQRGSDTYEYSVVVQRSNAICCIYVPRNTLASELSKPACRDLPDGDLHPSPLPHSLLYQKS